MEPALNLLFGNVLHHRSPVRAMRKDIGRPHFFKQPLHLLQELERFFALVSLHKQRNNLKTGKFTLCGHPCVLQIIERKVPKTQELIECRPLT